MLHIIITFCTFVGANILGYSLPNGGILTSDTVAVNNFVKAPKQPKTFGNEGDFFWKLIVNYLFLKQNSQQYNELSNNFQQNSTKCA